MEEVMKTIEDIFQNNWVKSALVIIIAIVIYKIISGVLSKIEKKNKRRNPKAKEKTYFRLVRNVIKYVFIILVILFLLQINGVNVSSLIAGVGILSVVIGFIVQDAFKDIVRGTDILSDNYFSVGDVVKYKDIEGKVTMLGLKTTKIEDIRTFNIISIANRNIEQIEVVSNSTDITVPMPYELPIARAEKVIKEMLDKIKLIENVDECMYKGINKLGESSVEYFINFRCNPTKKVPTRREVLRVVLETMNKNKISVPYNQIDVHNK